MAEVEEVFWKCCNLFKTGRIRQCMKDLETLTFKKYCVFELGQENNILICRSHVKVHIDMSNCHS